MFSSRPAAMPCWQAAFSGCEPPVALAMIALHYPATVLQDPPAGMAACSSPRLALMACLHPEQSSGRIDF